MIDEPNTLAWLQAPLAAPMLANGGRGPRRRVWPVEAVAMLLEGYRNAETIDAIAARLRKTRGAVAGKADRLCKLGLLCHRPSPFLPPKPRPAVARRVQHGERTLPLLPSERQEARETGYR
jgi:hypothetical protein